MPSLPPLAPFSAADGGWKGGFSFLYFSFFYNVPIFGTRLFGTRFLRRIPISGTRRCAKILTAIGGVGLEVPPFANRASKTFRIAMRLVEDEVRHPMETAALKLLDRDDVGARFKLPNDLVGFIPAACLLAGSEEPPDVVDL